MTSAEKSRYLTHIGLLSQQKRVRHVQNVAVRNLSTDRALLEDDAPEKVFFKFFKPGEREAFFTSTKSQDIANPSWSNLTLMSSCDVRYHSLPCVVIEIWGSNRHRDMLLISWKVNFRGLINIKEELSRDVKKFQPDSILFGLFDGVYIASDCLPFLVTAGKFCRSLEVEQSMASSTYDCYSLARLHTTQRAIKQTEASLSSIHDNIVMKLNQLKRRSDLLAEKEAVLMRIHLLKEEVRNQTVRLEMEQTECAVERENLNKATRGSSERWEKFTRNHRKLLEDQVTLAQRSKILANIGEQYQERKGTLIRELSNIYPVVNQGNAVYTILGVRLPNAEQYAGADDTYLAISLGHTCHLVLMIARFLQMPLRYPMSHLGSRSIVRDHISPHLGDKDRDFPLYNKGKEKLYFNYAVFLLNRNIVQVRLAMGLGTQDLKATLPNLKHLLETKWVGRRSNLAHNAAANQRPATSISSNMNRVPIQPANLPSNPPEYTSTNGPDLDTFPRSPPPPYQASIPANNLTNHKQMHKGQEIVTVVAEQSSGRTNGVLSERFDDAEANPVRELEVTSNNRINHSSNQEDSRELNLPLDLNNDPLGTDETNSSRTQINKNGHTQTENESNPFSKYYTDQQILVHSMDHNLPTFSEAARPSSKHQTGEKHIQKKKTIRITGDTSLNERFWEEAEDFRYSESVSHSRQLKREADMNREHINEYLLNSTESTEGLIDDINSRTDALMERHNSFSNFNRGRHDPDLEKL